MSAINNDILEDITKRLIIELNPIKIYLFGSYVWGNPSKDSDLDLLVVVKHSEFSPAKRASRAYRCLRDIFFPLDILVKTKDEMDRFSKVPAALESKIIRQGKLLYG